MHPSATPGSAHRRGTGPPGTVRPSTLRVRPPWRAEAALLFGDPDQIPDRRGPRASARVRSLYSRAGILRPPAAPRPPLNVFTRTFRPPSPSAPAMRQERGPRARKEWVRLAWPDGPRSRRHVVERGRTGRIRGRPSKHNDLGFAVGSRGRGLSGRGHREGVPREGDPP